MARTITQIETALVADVNSGIPGASTSQFAEWRLWVSIFARAIWAFENILDIFKVEVQTIIERKQPGTLDWYHEKSLEFQGQNIGGGVFQGDNLVVDNGVLRYETPDPSRRLITQAALSAGSGTLAIKLAKQDGVTTYQKLTSSELVAFAVYMDNIKYPGTTVNLISADADVITYDLEIVYDPVLTTVTVEANVLEKMEEFRTSLGFDDRLYSQKLVEKIMEAEGVVTVSIDGLDAYGYSTQTTTPVGIMWQLESGYFNFDPASTFTFTNYKTL
jgi:hypothetical protein